ncbi:MAG TPA: branched-chain amino acid ABC transporter permease [Gaiellaceae bacterium]|nr:branched-chain amino acid ABC transporter permease [Gaiellaceae bacterium]
MVVHSEVGAPSALAAWLPRSRGELLQRLPFFIMAGGLVFVAVWILFLANSTLVGSAVDNPGALLTTTFDALTIAGLYFIVASGFTLIFGLMRVVNMAHGSLFLLGGYIALHYEEQFVGGAVNSSVGGGIDPSQVSIGVWLATLVIGGAIVGLAAVAGQQLLLRWNQGQDLRQALITIAISFIAADQMIAHFGGISEDISAPGKIYYSYVLGVHYSVFRLVILGIAVVIGLCLWLWLHKTRTGMIIRAGVDDRQMVSALGINIQLVFALAFLVGGFLAGFGGGVGGSFASLAPEVDGNWLLNSLVVVIIGGMGSLGGAAVGAILYGFVTSFSATYLPTIGDNCCTQYSIIFTFALLAIVLALRPLGLFGRAA